MFLATSNMAKGLLHLSYIGHIDVASLQREHDNIVALLAELPAGFKMLVDLEHMESMDTDCIEELGKIMELLDQHEMEQVVRVIPDPTKDIGFNILARFHYHNNPRMTNCETMIQAVKLLGL
jgi:anti-anti-sigma regulatory factor